MLRVTRLTFAVVDAALVVVHIAGIARLAADALEPERARVRIQVRDPGDVPVARGDLALALAGGEVVQVQVAPVGVLTEPDELVRSEEHTSELQSLMRISYAVFCLKKKNESSTKAKSKTPN